MSKTWPFTFFPGMFSKDSDKSAEETEVKVEEAAVEQAPVEMPAEEPTPEESPEAEEAESAEKPLPEDDVDFYLDEEEDEILAFEHDLETALEEAHEEAVKKERTRKKVIAGLAILGAAGLATGFALRSYFKNR